METKLFTISSKIFDNLLLIFVFVISFLYLSYGWQYFDFRTYHFDEAISAYGAVRILNGDLPYKDFWTFHAPGRFYALAVVFKIFGISLKVAVLFAIFILTLTASGIYLFVSKISTKIFGLLALLLYLAWLKFYMVYNRPSQFAILFYVLSCFPFVKYITSNKNKYLVIMGILVGLIGLFRIDFGIYIFGSFFFVVLLRDINNKADNRKEKINIILKHEFFLFSVWFLVSFIFFLFFIFYGGFNELNSYVISGDWQKNRYLPFPKLNFVTIFYYIPLIIFLIASLRIWNIHLRKKIKDEFFYLKNFFLFSGIFLYSFTLRRADISHLLPTMLPAIILFVFLFRSFIKKFDKFKFLFFIWLAMFFLCILLLYSSLKPYIKAVQYIPRNIGKNKIYIPRANGIYDFSDYAQNQALAIKYIQDRTKSDDKIFVGNLRHDRVLNSDVMFYFLSERHSATKYYQFEPGFTNTQKIQRKIINDLLLNDIRYLVLWSASEDIKEPNDSCKSSGVRELDDFIKNHYKVEIVFGPYSIFKKA